MSAHARRIPQLTQAALAPTVAVEALDEYQNLRELRIADERPLTIYVDSHEIVTLMTLGSAPELLTLGYLKNQGLLDAIGDIESIQVDWEVNAAAVTTARQATGQNTDGGTDWRQRLGPRIVTTGCGQGTVYGDILAQLNGIAIKPLLLRQSALYALLKNLNACNTVYRDAGAVHGCALCRGADILSFIEDVGRHNAVDAIAGQMWLDDINGGDKLFYTTGRLSSEMVMKVAQMGIPALLSRSGITQMGLKLAQDFGITLLSRVQSRHFLIYNGAENICFDVALPAKRAVGNMKAPAT